MELDPRRFSATETVEPRKAETERRSQAQAGTNRTRRQDPVPRLPGVTFSPTTRVRR